MAGLATVRVLGAPAPVERVAEDICRAARAGRLRPGTSFSIRDIADERGVRFNSLRLLLDSMERQEWFTLRGDHGVVTPLDPRAARSMHRLRVTLHADLVTRSAALITSRRLDQLELVALNKPTGGVGQIYDAVYSARRDLWLNLCQPSATAWDLRLLRQTWDSCERYGRIGIDAVSQPAPDGTSGRDALMTTILSQYSDLIARCRARDPLAVAASVHRNSIWMRNLAEEGLATAS